jgi:ADP-ribose pyrophosphatase YjhB (NUDIX family)
VRVTKESIALIIREPGAGAARAPACGPGPRWLLVRRPDDDEDLPGVWGLPAGTRGPDESDADLVRRIGRNKLGVDVEPGVPVAEGWAERPAYRLEMRLWTATIVGGEPHVGAARDPSPVTRYTSWRWADASELGEGAARGSLCCRLGMQVAAAGPR